jgi:hypothetical protein
MDGVLSITQRKEIRAAFDMGARAYGQNEWYKVYAQIFSGGIHGGPKSSNSAYEDIGFMVGLRNIVKKENLIAPATELTAPEPKTFRVVHETYDGAYSYYYEIIKNDKTGYYRMVAASLGEARMYTRELVGHEYFNRSGDPTFTTGWDNLPLASNAHKLLNGATYDNTLAAAGVSETLLNNIMNYFDAVPDHQGRVGKVSNLTIFTHISNLRAWRQLLNADVAFTHPQGGANQNPAIRNLFSADNITVVGTPYLIGTNKHIVLGPKHGFFWFDRDRYDEMIPEQNPRRETHVVFDQLAKGCSDARQVLVIG